MPEVIEALGMEFDFCFLDTVHKLPGELLDYLVALPFMRDGGIVAAHDTALYYRDPDSIATRVLMAACAGKHIVPPQSGEADANLSAFQITPCTFEQAGNLFSALALPWSYILDDRQMRIYYDFFKKYYGNEAADWLVRITRWNNRQGIRNLGLRERIRQKFKE